MTEQPEKGRRKGRGRGDRDEVPNEELGWIADLRQAREEGGDLGPGDLGPGADDDGEGAPPPGRSSRWNLLGGRRSAEEPLPDPDPAEPAPEPGSRRARRDARRSDPRPPEPRAADPRTTGDLPAVDPRGESRWSAFRRSDPDPPPPPAPRDEPRLSEPEPPRDQPRQDSTRDRLGSRFASLRGVRSGTGQTPVVPGPVVPGPVVPAPATSPLSPEVLAPGRSAPPQGPQRAPSERTRPRDPDEPGRHESHGASGRTPSPPPPARQTPPGRQAPRGAAGRPAEPGWADLTTGEKPPLEPRGDVPGGRRPAGPPPGPRSAPPAAPRSAPPAAPRSGPPGGPPAAPRSGPPAAPRSGPPMRSTGVPPGAPVPVDGPPRRPGGPPPGDNRPRRPGGPPPGEAGPRRPGPPMDPGHRAPAAPAAPHGGPPRTAPAPSGPPPFSDPTLAGPPGGGPPVTGRPPRRGTGEQQQYRRSTGEQPQYRRSTGEHAVLGPPPPPRHSTGEQPVVERTSGHRDEVRRQPGRAPVVALAVAAIVFLVGLPMIMVGKDASADPVFAGLDSLQVPGWAAQTHQDTTLGNRWCLDSCRTRERIWRSAKPAQATDPVYRQALTDAGWKIRQAASCPAPLTGTTTCWEHDEYVLKLWSRDAACDLSNVAPAPSGAAPGAPVPSGAPGGVDPSAAVPAPSGTDPPPTCGGSLVTVKVGEVGDPNWPR